MPQYYAWVCILWADRGNNFLSVYKKGGLIVQLLFPQLCLFFSWVLGMRFLALFQSLRSLWFYFTLLQPCLLATFSVHWKNVLFQLVKCSVLVCSVNRMAVPYAAHDAVHPVPVPSSRNSVYIQLICNSKYVTETQCQLNYAFKELSQSKRHNIIQAGIVVTTR